MGQSTNAILFYGYCWDEEAHSLWEIDVEEDDEEKNGDVAADDDDDDKNDWETRYARTKGCLPPSTPFPDRAVTPTRENGWNYSAAERAVIKQHKTYWEKKRKIAEASSCLVDSHCSGECPMPYVAIRTSVTTSRRGYPTKIKALTVDPTWNASLAEFCKELGIKTKGKKAAWWLVSDWN